MEKVFSPRLCWERRVSLSFFTGHGMENFKVPLIFLLVISALLGIHRSERALNEIQQLPPPLKNTECEFANIFMLL